MPEFEGPITIEEKDHKELIDLLNAVFRPDGGCMLADYPRHLGLNNQENIRVIKMDGRIMAHVATSIRSVALGGIHTEVAGIGAVATHPDARGMQLASKLMQDAVTRSADQGADIMLISGDLGIYRRMNATDCGRYPVVRVQKSDLAPDGKSLKLEKAGKKDISSIVALRESLAIRYQLPREDLEALLECGKAMDVPSDWWMVIDEGETVGFGVIHQKGSELTLIDWAGHVNALEGAVIGWMNEYGVETLHYTCADRSMLPLSWRPYIQKERGFDGTVLVIHARRFLRRAKGFLTERIGENFLEYLRIGASGQQAKFAMGSDEVEFSNGGELADFFFGAVGKDILAEKISKDTELYKVLSCAFPVPLVWYGIGYV